MRRTPYTERGIRRVPCRRCGKPSRHQWQICADQRQYRGVCADCDVELNKLVMEFFGFDNLDHRMALYRRKMSEDYDERP